MKTRNPVSYEARGIKTDLNRRDLLHKCREMSEEAGADARNAITFEDRIVAIGRMQGVNQVIEHIEKVTKET